MAIDFNKLATAGAHASTLNFDKAVEVSSGERINFAKENPGVNKLRMELYWESDHDGDAAAVLLGGDKKAVPGGIVFYGQLELPGVVHSGDVRGDTDGDPSTPEETIRVDLSGLDDAVESVLLVASTYAQGDKATPFGKLRECRVLVINDETNDVLYGYELDEDYSTYTSVELCSFYKRSGEWRMTNMGEGVGTSPKALEDIAAKYEIK